MSLYFALYPETPTIETCKCDCCGNEHERKFCGPHYDTNITHNLTKMAAEAGVYECLWRPNENGFIKAEQLIEPLEIGLQMLNNKPYKFKKFNPSNNLGSYEELVDEVRGILATCYEFPNALIKARG